MYQRRKATQPMPIRAPIKKDSSSSSYESYTTSEEKPVTPPTRGPSSRKKKSDIAIETKKVGWSPTLNSRTGKWVKYDKDGLAEKIYSDYQLRVVQYRQKKLTLADEYNIPISDLDSIVRHYRLLEKKKAQQK